MNNRRFVQIITESAARYPASSFTQKGTINTCVNPYSYHLMRRYADVYLCMDGIYVDGLLMCKVINMLWKRKIPRLSFDMSGMAVDLFARLNANDETIYFVGAQQEQIEASISKIKEAYPRINIAGFRNGYFLQHESRTQEIEKIVNINPDFVIVGMGAPIQEQFAIDLKEAGYKGIVFTCGGFLHQTANGINYYPKWINKYNLRAFYRMYKEKGLIKRMYNVLIEFPLLFTIDTIVSKLSSSKE